MTEREKLIEILKAFCTEDCKITHQCGYCDYGDLPVCASAVADHLLSNGVIVPPCKVGDKIYDATEFFSDIYPPEIYELQDNVMTIEKGKNGEYIFTYDGMYIYPEEIGKTVFLTKEEAEKSIKGKELRK